MSKRKRDKLRGKLAFRIRKNEVYGENVEWLGDLKKPETVQPFKVRLGSHPAYVKPSDYQLWMHFDGRKYWFEDFDPRTLAERKSITYMGRNRAMQVLERGEISWRP